MFLIAKNGYAKCIKPVLEKDDQSPPPVEGVMVSYIQLYEQR